MTVRNFAECASILVRDCLRTNLPAALANVDAQRPDGKVSLEAPKSYFFHDRVAGYKTPAVFLVADEIDTRKAQKGANFIAAMTRLNVSTVLEDKDADLLTIRSYRYQDALHEVLDQTRLTTTDLTVTLIVVVTKFAFSPLYSNAVNRDESQAIFRKEILTELEIEHYENF
jgi:hypothetical protein